MNKLRTKYSRYNKLDFKHKRFRFLNGEIISKAPYEKNTLRKLKSNQEITMIAYDKYTTKHLFWKVPQVSQFSWMIPEPAQSFHLALKKVPDNSGLFQKFPQYYILTRI